jgi:hypothetical protein
VPRQQVPHLLLEPILLLEVIQDDILDHSRKALSVIELDQVVLPQVSHDQFSHVAHEMW